VTGCLYRGKPWLAEVNKMIFAWRADPETAPPGLSARHCR